MENLSNNQVNPNNKEKVIAMNDNKNKISDGFWRAKHWASIERENQVNADRLTLYLAVSENEKNIKLINTIAKSQKRISENAKKIKETYQRKLKEELSKSKIILGETSESTYNKIRRIVDITELKESSIYVDQTNLGTYVITTEDYVNVIFEGTANEVLLIIQIISGYDKEELYKKLCEREQEEKEREELMKKRPKYTKADFAKDVKENIDKMQAIRGKFNEVYEMMENFKDIVCLGEEQFSIYYNIKRGIVDDDRYLKEMENIFTIYLQETLEEIKNQGGKENV